jgi:hypothetical protein
MMATDADMLRHELAHAIGCMIAGANAVKITISDHHAQTVPAWPGNVCSDEQLLTGLIAGRAYVVAGMSTVIDEDQIAEADPEVVERIEALILPEVQARLAAVGPTDIASMLAVIAETGGLILRPEPRVLN